MPRRAREFLHLLSIRASEESILELGRSRLSPGCGNARPHSVQKLQRSPRLPQRPPRRAANEDRHPASPLSTPYEVLIDPTWVTSAKSGSAAGSCGIPPERARQPV
jgi:hypothetical protein